MGCRGSQVQILSPRPRQQQENQGLSLNGLSPFFFAACTPPLRRVRVNQPSQGRSIQLTDSTGSRLRSQSKPRLANLARGRRSLRQRRSNRAKRLAALYPEPEVPDALENSLCA